MFDLGIQELFVIFIVALLAFGPKRLPDIARSIGRGIAEIKNAMEGVKTQIDTEMNEVKDLKEHLKDPIALKNEIFKDESLIKPYEDPYKLPDIAGETVETVKDAEAVKVEKTEKEKKVSKAGKTEKVSKPEKVSKSRKVKEPAKVKEPVQVKEPVKVKEPAKVKEPVKVKEPAKVKKLAKVKKAGSKDSDKGKGKV
jgi:Tat protein translocase TatB subunit